MPGTVILIPSLKDNRTIGVVYNKPSKRVILSEVEAWRNEVEEPHEGCPETFAGFFDCASLRSE